MPSRGFQTRVQQIIRDNIDAQQIEQARKEQPNGSLADDERIVAREQGESFDSF